MIKGNIFNLNEGDIVLGFKEGGEEFFKPILKKIGLEKTKEVFRRKEDGMRLVKFQSVNERMESQGGFYLAIANITRYTKRVGLMK